MTSRRKTQLLIVYILVVFLFADVVSAASTSAQTVEKATVNLFCRIKTGGKTYIVTGSGVFIHKSGVILSNAHVAQYFLLQSAKPRKARCSIRTGSPARDRYFADVIYIAADWAEASIESAAQDKPKRLKSDFALLRVTGVKSGDMPESFPAIPLDFGLPLLQEGETVAIEGYPSEGSSATAIQRKLDRIVATSTITSILAFTQPYHDLLSIAPSLVSAGGVSGGPVLRSSGGLIGLATAVAEREKIQERSLRAITLGYIDRTLRIYTGKSLIGFATDPLVKPLDAGISPFPELLKSAERQLRNIER
ncbi:trypsin-like peptidase domain-containing protein [Candidatus Kaiserbacteria bacterium]|nr:trypsin-like peptidase domain-containing protein [Candidatus Kaiserbacteria bacterium]